LFSLFQYKFVCFFIFARLEVHHVISRYPFLYVFGSAFSQALVILFVNSVSSFELLERLDSFVLISFLYSCFQCLLLVRWLFSVLFVADQCLYRDPILWCYDHCWSHLVPFCSSSFCPWVPFSAVISILDFLPVYPWYVDGYPGSFVIQSSIRDSIVLPRRCLPSYLLMIEKNHRLDFAFTIAHYIVFLR